MKTQVLKNRESFQLTQPLTLFTIILLSGILFLTGKINNQIWEKASCTSTNTGRSNFSEHNNNNVAAIITNEN